MHSGITVEQFNTRLKTIAMHLDPLRPKDHSQDGLRAVNLQSSTRNSGTVGATAMLLALAGFVNFLSPVRISPTSSSPAPFPAPTSTLSAPRFLHLPLAPSAPAAR